MLSIKPRWASVNGSNSPCDCSTVARFGAGWRTAPRPPRLCLGLVEWEAHSVLTLRTTHPPHTHDSATYDLGGYYHAHAVPSHSRPLSLRRTTGAPGPRQPRRHPSVLHPSSELPTSGRVSPLHHCPLRRDTTTFVTDRYMEEDKCTQVELRSYRRWSFRFVFTTE